MEWVSLILAGMVVVGMVLRMLNVIMIQFNRFLTQLRLSADLLQKFRRFQKRRNLSKRKKDASTHQGK